MKLIKINNDHYIVIKQLDKLEFWKTITKDTFCYNLIDKSIKPWSMQEEKWDNLAIIIRSTERDAYGFYPSGLNLNEVKELTGEPNVLKKSQEMVLSEQAQLGFLLGYNKCLMDNIDKKYTENELHFAYLKGRNSSNYEFEDILKLLQPKTEWEVEIIDGKLKLL